MLNDNSFVLKGDLCWSRDRDSLETVENGFLVCVDGVSAGAYSVLPERYENLPLVDCAGKLVIPGLTDLHVHAPQYAFRGLGMDLELLDWLEAQGGVPGMEAIKHKKAQMLYDVLDRSKLFTCAAEAGSRSDMNVTFRSVSEELNGKFVQEAAAAGFTNLKGHRNVGGMRASIYNAMPTEGIEKLCDFIQDFDKKN